MITVDSDPKLNPIKIGAFILNKMSTYNYTEIEIEELYKHVINEFGASYDVFAYTLDWLFVAGAIELNSKVNITREAN